jgi:hypothetical protein
MFLSKLTQDSNDSFVINISKDYRDITYDFFEENEIFEIVSLRIKEINNLPLKEYLGVEQIS